MTNPAETDLDLHQALATWAAECAARVLWHLEKGHPTDPRPREAIGAARAWAAGEVRVGEARARAFAAHAAAREVSGAARLAARAAGNAAATVHVAAHAEHAADYAVPVLLEGEGPEEGDRERAWQMGSRPG